MKQTWRRAAALAAAALLLISAGAAAETPDAGSPAAVVTAAPDTTKTLKKGSKGEAVRQLQERLAELGYSPGEPDGIYGQKTVAAVQAFQRRNGLKESGKATPETLKILYSDGAVPVPEPVVQDALAGELPLLVNPAHPLDETFMPDNLVLLADAVDSRLLKVKYPDTLVVAEAAEALERMLEAAEADGVTTWQVSSAYRSAAAQEEELEAKIRHYLKKNSGWSRARARKAALKTVAEPGTSEHQTGLAIDINVPGKSSFAGTEQCKWLHAHCWEYGFIVRYQKGKEKITGYTAEAWHIRYVGTEHAMRIRELGLCLEEYLEGIENGTVTPPAAAGTEADGAEDGTDAEIETEILIDDEGNAA